MTSNGEMPSRGLRLPRVGDVLRTFVWWTGAVLRRVRPARWPSAFQTLWQREMATMLVIAFVVGISMGWVDVPLARAMADLPPWVTSAFDEITDFGRASWSLVPLGILYLATVVIASTQFGRFTYRVCAAVAVRLGYMFVAIGLPGLVVTIVKRLIGRVRPSEFGPFAYHPFSWRSEYASLPSGHTTTAFATLVAVGIILPRLRPLLWVFAMLIAMSRVVLTSHYLSDVITAAACGSLGAILIRDWFAARRLAFVITPDGEVRRLPGPSWQRLKRVARATFSP